MPSFNQHHDHCQHNINFLSSFFLHHSNDWSNTVMFYTSIHLIEAVLDKNGKHSKSHFDRDSLISCTNCNSRLYKRLKKAAQKSRYIDYKVYQYESLLLYKEALKPLLIWFNSSNNQNLLVYDKLNEAVVEWHKREKEGDKTCRQCN